MTNQSSEVAKVAIKMALTTREEESAVSRGYMKDGYKTAAVDIGGQLPGITPKIIERALVAAKRNGVIEDKHAHDGAVIGAVREALSQIALKTHGLNAGGKVGIARKGEHISVAIFMSIGLLHLNEVVIGFGHRSLADE
ncbi:HutP family protein [Fusibacter sp. JL298sf-3]